MYLKLKSCGHLTVRQQQTKEKLNTFLEVCLEKDLVIIFLGGKKNHHVYDVVKKLQEHIKITYNHFESL